LGADHSGQRFRGLYCLLDQPADLLGALDLSVLAHK